MMIKEIIKINTRPFVHPENNKLEIALWILPETKKKLRNERFLATFDANVKWNYVLKNPLNEFSLFIYILRVKKIVQKNE